MGARYWSSIPWPICEIYGNTGSLLIFAIFGSQFGSLCSIGDDETQLFVMPPNLLVFAVVNLRYSDQH